RTPDLVVVKHVPYFGHRNEPITFMRFRSMRLSTAYPEFFQTQLRAILRAGGHGQVSLLFPMISTLEEVLRLKRAVARARRDLERQGVAHAAELPIGVMLEVPAAAVYIHRILREVDLVRHTPLDFAREVAEQVLRLHTSRGIRKYLMLKVQEIWPNVNVLDVRK